MCIWQNLHVQSEVKQALANVTDRILPLMCIHTHMHKTTCASLPSYGMLMCVYIRMHNTTCVSLCSGAQGDAHGYTEQGS